MRLDGGGAAIGHQELAAPPARAGDAVGKGAGEPEAGAGAIPPPPCGGEPGRGDARRGARRRPHPSLPHEGEGTGRRSGKPVACACRASLRASRRASSARGLRSRRKAASRSLRFTAAPPRPRSVSSVAISAACVRRALASRIDQHARQPRRQRQPRDGAALVGDAPVGVERAEPLQQRVRLGEGRARRRIEERAGWRGRRRPRARDRARSRRDRRRESPAAHRARGRRWPPPPTAGSIRRARRGRRGRAADRRWRARRAPSPAASGPGPARSGARA